MSEYLISVCDNCAGRIEFPDEGVGEEVECPHCGVQTKLHDPSEMLGPDDIVCACTYCGQRFLISNRCLGDHLPCFHCGEITKLDEPRQKLHLVEPPTPAQIDFKVLALTRHLEKHSLVGRLKHVRDAAKKALSSFSIALATEGAPSQQTAHEAPPQPAPRELPKVVECKACGEVVAVLSEVCVHCGQSWPGLPFPCPRCNQSDFDIRVPQGPLLLVPANPLVYALGSLFQSAVESAFPDKWWMECRRCGYKFVLA